MEWNQYQIDFINWAKGTCRENRLGLMKMLLSNLKRQGIVNVQNICAKIKQKERYSLEETTDKLKEDEDGWWELKDAARLTDWAGITREYVLVGFIKDLLVAYRKDEVQQIRSSTTYHARERLLYPERLVSRRKSVPSPVGWWSSYQMDEIIAVDCEMVSKIIERRTNGKPRCKNVVGTVSVISTAGNVIYKRTVKHDPSDVYLTPKMKSITGFHKHSFKDGTELAVVQEELGKLFNQKLLILIAAGSDFQALGMDRGNFDVFDLHEHYTKDTGKIGLRSIVYHYYKIDIQSGVHDPDIDAKYTMKVFLDYYIPDKLAHPDECFSRSTTRRFNEIATIKG